MSGENPRASFVGEFGQTLFAYEPLLVDGALCDVAWFLRRTTSYWFVCNFAHFMLIFTFQTTNLRFSIDHRIREVRRLLQSSRPVHVSLVQNPEVRWEFYTRLIPRQPNLPRNQHSFGEFVVYSFFRLRSKGWFIHPYMNTRVSWNAAIHFHEEQSKCW